MSANQDPVWLQKIAHGYLVSVWVQPGGRVSEFLGLHDSVPKIRLAARAVEGAANEELIDFLSKFMGLKKSNLRIVKGEHSRRKVVLVCEASDQHILKLASWKS